MPEHTFLLGPLTVSFSDDPFCEDVLESMYGQLPESSSPVDVRIRGFDWRDNTLPSSKGTRATDKLSQSDGVVRVDKRRPNGPPVSWVTDRIGNRGCVLQISGWELDTLTLDVYYDGTLYENGLFPLRWALKANNNTFVSYTNGLAKHFVYNIFEPLVQGWMLSQSLSFLHAASINTEKGAVVITGTGGAGKTSSTTTLIRQSQDIEFLSDDLVFVSGEGEVYPYYKSSMVYAYNTVGDSIDEEELLNGVPDRIHWKWRKHQFGDHGARRRVAPEALFEGQVGSPEAKDLRAAIFLVREERDAVQHETISNEELSRRSTGVIFDELDWLFEYSAALCSIGSTITPSSMLSDVEAVYREVFKGAEKVLVHVPTGADPDVLARYIRSEILNK